MEINELVSDIKFVKHVINMCIPIHKMYEMCDMNWSYEHNVYCAFHDNNETPSARMYQNSDGSTTLWCFSEQRMYRPSDFITKELINTRIESIFYRVWKQLSDDRKESLLNSYNVDIDFISDNWKSRVPKMELFKSGKITLSELRLEILRGIL